MFNVQQSFDKSESNRDKIVCYFQKVCVIESWDILMILSILVAKSLLVLIFKLYLFNADYQNTTKIDENNLVEFLILLSQLKLPKYRSSFFILSFFVTSSAFK